MFSKILTLIILAISLQVHAYTPPEFILTDNKVPVKVVTNLSNEYNGTIIIAHGCKGVTPHEEMVGMKLAEEGFNTVVIDSWKYRNVNHVCENNAVKSHERLEEVYKTVDWINRQKWHSGKIFLIGYSHGGMVALAASKHTKEKGINKAVAFYPYCFPSDHVEPKIPTQVHIGEKDDWTPAQRCRGMYDGLFRKYKNGEYFEYPNAYHGFDLKGVDRVIPGIGQGGIVKSRIIRFDRSSTITAYTRTLKFFKESK